MSSAGFFGFIIINTIIIRHTYKGIIPRVPMLCTKHTRNTSISTGRLLLASLIVPEIDLKLKSV